MWIGSSFTSNLSYIVWGLQFEWYCKEWNSIALFQNLVFPPFQSSVTQACSLQNSCLIYTSLEVFNLFYFLNFCNFFSLTFPSALSGRKRILFHLKFLGFFYFGEDQRAKKVLSFFFYWMSSIKEYVWESRLFSNGHNYVDLKLMQNSFWLNCDYYSWVKLNILFGTAWKILSLAF